MPRPLRVEYPGAWYYVVQWGDSQVKPFKTDAQKELWLTVVQEASALYGLEIHAYCLFNSHYHLLIHTPKQPLSPGIRHINSMYTQRYQLQTQKTGSLFKNRYKSVLLDETAGYVQRMGRFIHRLPLLYRFKEPLFKFSYSSYPAYIQEHPKPEELRVSYLLSYHAGTHKLKSFYDYTESAEDNELSRFYKKKKWAPHLGNPHPTTRRFQRDEAEVMQTIIKSTAAIFKEREPDIIESRRGRGNQQLGRTVAMYLCRHVGHIEIKQIAKVFNVSHFSAVTVRLKRFESVLSGNEALQHKLKMLKKTVGQFQV